MAVHESVLSMVQHSLREYLLAARLCVEYRQGDGGCLGYPAATLLFSLIDALGSYYHGQDVTIEGKLHRIHNASHHVYVLNASPFGGSLSLGQLREIADAARSVLVHHALVAPGWSLVAGPLVGCPFGFEGERLREVNLDALLPLCERAVERFLIADGPRLIPGGRVERDMIARAAARSSTRHRRS